MEQNIDFKRKIYDELIKWNNNPDKVPLIVDGLRQVGKSYIVDKFAHDNYENVIIYDFRNNLVITGLNCESERFLMSRYIFKFYRGYPYISESFRHFDRFQLRNAGNFWKNKNIK